MSAILKPVVLWLALVAGMVGFSNSAFADWQGTVWGMSPEEADKSFRIPHDPPVERAPGPAENEYDAYVSFTYTAVGNLDFINGKLLFKDKELRTISMQLKDPNRCDELIRVLGQIYGKPAADKERSVTNTMMTAYRDLTWNDKKGRNEISLRYITWNGLDPDCDLDSDPFNASDPGGSGGF